jgi:hypothetical protein
VADVRPIVPATPLLPKACPWEPPGGPETEVEVSEDGGARWEGDASSEGSIAVPGGGRLQVPRNAGGLPEAPDSESVRTERRLIPGHLIGGLAS